MKKISAITLLLFSLIASAQNKVAEDTTAKPAITAIGKADGLKTEMKIGKVGGRFASSDRKVELIIPEGAVTKKTAFSILPVTNMVPNGNGKAYRLEPSGVQFQKPVQLIFHYTEEESADSMQLLMGIAMQDNTGQWYGLKNFTLDTITKTVSGHINHFSDWSKFEAIKLDPGHKRVKISKRLTLQILGVVPKPKDGDDDDELSPLYRTREPKQLIWKVNDVPGGNAGFGTISGYAGSDDRKLEYGQFLAPDVVPDTRNPVAVTVNLKGLTYKFNNIVFKELKLVSNLLIYDNAYEVKMISVVNGNEGGVLGACSYKDTGSFVVSLNGKESRIIERVNNNADASLDYNGQCTIVRLRPGSGNIHIAGRQVIKITPPSTPNGPATIEITFSRYPTIYPLLQFTCPDGNGGTFTSTNEKANAFSTFRLTPGGPLFPALGTIDVPFAAAPDLGDASRFVAPADFIWNDNLPVDLDGHGTHVAGTIGQLTNNGLGTAGMAFNVRLMPVKVIQEVWDDVFGSPNFGTDDTIARGIRYAADNGARVINLSIGREEGGPAPAVEDAVRYAVSRGAFVAMASGNSRDTGNQANRLADAAPRIDGFVAVGAVGRGSTQLAYYSTTNAYVELAAPGGDFRRDPLAGGVLQQTLNLDLLLTFETGDPSRLQRPRADAFDYYYFQGTSMATPHVSGLAALLMQQGITSPAAIEAAMEQFATDRGAPGRDNEYGFGVINPRATLVGLGLAR